MNCRRCGKSLGTDRGICPFCGATLSPDQMEVYKQYKKENQYHEAMVTEKYNGQKVFYEKREYQDHHILFFLGGVILFLLIILIVLLVVFL